MPVPTCIGWYDDGNVVGQLSMNIYERFSLNLTEMLKNSS